MKLSIVIPAYNEEQAIGSIIERCLDARVPIAQCGRLDDVEIIVVSDGSTDRTVEIARRFDDIRLIVFERNRGYGAAIQEGFVHATGDVLGFLDADGTCDPLFFAELCNALVRDGADVAIGSRLGPESRMPRVRRFGNRVYALILSAISNRVVTDTASGMRVVRRNALPQLLPLPDGLHFTPAMSARVLLDDRLKIVESPMPYEERIGNSKLRVVNDGIRFLQTILTFAWWYRPGRILYAVSTVCILIAALLSMHPLESWIRRGGFAEDQIYRLLFCSWLGTISATALSAGVLCDHIQRIVRPRDKVTSFGALVLDTLFTWRGLTGLTVAFTASAAWLVGKGCWTRLTSGLVDVHWSRVVLAGLIAFTWCQMLVTVLIADWVRFHIRRNESARGTSIRSSAAVPADSLGIRSSLSGRAVRDSESARTLTAV